MRLRTLLIALLMCVVAVPTSAHASGADGAYYLARGCVVFAVLFGLVSGIFSVTNKWPIAKGLLCTFVLAIPIATAGLRVVMAPSNSEPLLQTAYFAAMIISIPLAVSFLLVYLGNYLRAWEREGKK
jgi:hypothetical protein